MTGQPSPKTWRRSPLRLVADIERDSVSPDAIDPGTTYVGLEHVKGDGTFGDCGPAETGKLRSNKFRFTPEHLLYGKLRPYLRKIANPEFDGICSTDILPIRPKANMDRSYLRHFLRQPKMIELATERSSGANLPRISPTILAEFQIDYPSDLNEQKRIAAILDKAEAIRRKRQQAIALTEDLLRSIFLGSVGTGADGYDGWAPVPVEELAESRKGSIRSGPFGSALRHAEFVDAGIAVLGIDNAVKNRFEWAERRFITQEKYEELRRYTVFPGDVLITIMGTTGRSSVVPDDIPAAITTKHLATLTLQRDVVEPEFLSHAIHMHPSVLKQIGSANRGAIMAGLNLGLIRKLEIRLPPIQAQRDFVGALARIRILQAKLERSLPDDLFGSLSQRAFAGQLGC